MEEFEGKGMLRKFQGEQNYKDRVDSFNYQGYLNP